MHVPGLRVHPVGRGHRGRRSAMSACTFVSHPSSATAPATTPTERTPTHTAFTSTFAEPSRVALSDRMGEIWSVLAVDPARTGP